jgi:hypothetical protein
LFVFVDGGILSGDGMHRLGLLFIAMNKPAHTPASDSSPAAAHKVTPMMAQYLEIKQANPDSLLFYRMGDFYELFFKDAEVASAALGIALTKRGKHLGDDIPMCGVPVHAADDYLQKLIRLGHRVAVCEQTEDPAEAKKRGSKAVVRRDVVRLVNARYPDRGKPVAVGPQQLPRRPVEGALVRRYGAGLARHVHR